MPAQARAQTTQGTREAQDGGSSEGDVPKLSVSSSLAGQRARGLLDVILDKGLVIDAYIRVSFVGIELLTIDARIVIASVDTYLKFAQAVNRLDLASQEGGLPDLLEHGAEGLNRNGRKQEAKDEQEQNQKQ